MSKDNPAVEVKPSKKSGLPTLFLRDRYIGHIKRGRFIKPVNIKYRTWESYGIEVPILFELMRRGVMEIVMKIGTSWFTVPIDEFADSDLECEYGGLKQRHLKLYQIKKISQHIYEKRRREYGKKSMV